MTKEQEQVIREAAETAWYKEATFKGGSIESVVTAIRAYDEQINGTAKASENDNVVIFSKRGNYSESRVFDSKEEMLQKLNEEYDGQIAMADDGFVYNLREAPDIGYYKVCKKG